MFTDTAKIIAINQGQQTQKKDPTTGAILNEFETTVNITLSLSNGTQFPISVSETDAAAYTFGASGTLTFDVAAKAASATT